LRPADARRCKHTRENAADEERIARIAAKIEAPALATGSPHHSHWRSHLCNLCRPPSAKRLEHCQPLNDQPPRERQSASLPRKTQRYCATWKVDRERRALIAATRPAKPPSSADRG